MAFELVNMNLTALQTIEPYNFTETNASLTSIITSANSYTNDLVLVGSMMIIFIVMYLALSDKSVFQEFGYDDMRGLCISFASAVLIGVTALSVGWSSNFYIIGMFTTMWIFNFIFILVYEGTE